MDTITTKSNTSEPEFLAPTKTDEYVLSASDRGDCCYSQAYYKVWLRVPNTPALLFCRHHYLKNEDSLVLSAKKILDESHKLTENRAVGSEN